MSKRMVVLTVCLAGMIGGCSKGPGIATYPVAGKVTYNDKPLAGATVIYVSNNPDAPRSSGITDEDGRFSLTTYVSASQVLRGAPAGDYDVIVMKEAAREGGVDEMAKMEQMSPEERAAMMTKMMQPTTPNERPSAAAGGAVPVTKPKWEVPEKYTRVDSSPLKATVATGENPAAEFKLHD